MGLLWFMCPPPRLYFCLGSVQVSRGILKKKNEVFMEREVMATSSHLPPISAHRTEG